MDLPGDRGDFSWLRRRRLEAQSGRRHQHHHHWIHPC